jgi:class 3 adenylate cyclase
MVSTKHLSIQSKLILLLLVVSLGSMAAMAFIGYRTGDDALHKAVTNQLTSLCKAKKNQIDARRKFTESQVMTLAEAPMIVGAMREFRAGCDKLKTPLTNEQEAKLQGYYEKDFLPALGKALGGSPILKEYLPRTPAGRHLQYWYIANNADQDKENLEAAEDKSDYTTEHKKVHPLIRGIRDRFGYDDILLVRPDTGVVVYSVEKNPEFGTSLFDGPYSESNLAELVRQMRKVQEEGVYRFVPFEPYRPRLTKPAAFVATAIRDGEGVIGLLVFGLRTRDFSDIINGEMAWEKEGLGTSGEVYLVGPDGRMWSESRFYLHNAEAYLESLPAAGYSEKEVETIRLRDTTVFIQEVRNEAFEKGMKGESGVGKMKDYRGVPVLAAYEPIEGAGDRWVIVAKQDLDEAFAPIRAFHHLVGIAAGIMTLVVSLLAVWLSSRFVRPIHRLIDGARQVSAGKLDVSVDVPTTDEFHELAGSFNQMTSSLKLKSALAEEKTREHERLLLSVLPARAAACFKEGGEQQISESHADVTVLFAEISDFLDLTRTLPPDRAVGLFNDLIVAFDEAAERLGVEKVKTIGSSYMAACGLTAGKVDHAHRMVEFAQEMERIVRHFNQERGTNLSLQVSIHSGPVVGGVVGRTRFLYDLWGDTVNVARALQADGPGNTIRVTEAVFDRLREQHAFTGPELVRVAGKGAVNVWEVANGNEPRTE